MTGNSHGLSDESDEISDKEFYIAEDLFFAFIKATQKDALARLELNYGSDSLGEILKALKSEFVDIAKIVSES